MDTLAWTFLAFLSLVAFAVGLCAWLLTKATRKRSPQSRSADGVWQTEIETQLADLESRVAALSSSLRKLHGRTSKREMRDPELSAESDDDVEARRNRLRIKAGLIRAT
jgi:Flp pilus assembly protein TadB